MNGHREVTPTTDRGLWQTWGQYVAVAAAYEAVYEIIYHVSYEQFLLTTGLRLACMLLLPPRYWLALAVGESIPLLENAIFCAPNFGLPWAALTSVPTVALWWPVLRPLCRRSALQDAHGRIRMPVILGATFAVAVVTATIMTASLVAALLHTPGHWADESPGRYFVVWLLGAYLGALTLTPVILALKERYGALPPRSFTVRTIWRSVLLRDTLGWVAPALITLTWLTSLAHDGGSRQLAQLALIWPVIGLTWRHGWHGAAVGGMAASFALAVTAENATDPHTLQVQIVLAAVLTAALWMTARVPRRSAEVSARPPGL